MQQAFPQTVLGHTPEWACRQGCVQAPVHFAADEIHCGIAVVPVIHSKEADSWAPSVWE